MKLDPAICFVTAWIRLPYTIASGVRLLTEISSQLGTIENYLLEVRECAHLGVRPPRRNRRRVVPVQPPTAVAVTR